MSAWLMFGVGLFVGAGASMLWTLLVLEQKRPLKQSGAWLDGKFREHKRELQDYEDQARGSEWGRSHD